MEEYYAFAHDNPEQGGDPGMTIRTFMIGQALSGFASNHGHTSTPYKYIAEQAIDLADELIRQMYK